MMLAGVNDKQITKTTTTSERVDKKVLLQGLRRDVIASLLQIDLFVMANERKKYER